MRSKLPMMETAAGTKKTAMWSRRKSAARLMDSMRMTPESRNTSRSTMATMFPGMPMGTSAAIFSPVRHTA